MGEGEVLHLVQSQELNPSPKIITRNCGIAQSGGKELCALSLVLTRTERSLRAHLTGVEGKEERSLETFLSFSAFKPLRNSCKVEVKVTNGKGDFPVCLQWLLEKKKSRVTFFCFTSGLVMPSWARDMVGTLQRLWILYTPLKGSFCFCWLWAFSCFPPERTVLETSGWTVLETSAWFF